MKEVVLREIHVNFFFSSGTLMIYFSFGSMAKKIKTIDVNSNDKSRINTTIKRKREL